MEAAQLALPSCAICLSNLTPGEANVECPACRAPYHSDCWSDNGGCGAYGCRLVPKTEGLKPLEIPPAYWGREDKDCPSCGKTILAMAVRCRYCGAAIEAKPEEKATYARQQRRKAGAPALRRLSTSLLVGSLIPGVAAVASIVAYAVYKSRRTDIRALRGSYEALFKIAIAVGAFQSIVLLVAWAIFMMKATF